MAQWWETEHRETESKIEEQCKHEHKANVTHATKLQNFVAQQSCVSDIVSCPTFDKLSN